MVLITIQNMVLITKKVELIYVWVLMKIYQDVKTDERNITVKQNLQKTRYVQEIEIEEIVVKNIENVTFFVKEI